MVPLALSRRLAIVNDLLGEHSTEKRRLLAILAIERAVSRSVVVTLRPSYGSQPLGTTPRIQNQDVWTYFEALLELLESQSQLSDPEVAASATRAMTKGASELAVHGNCEPGLRWFSSLVDRLLEADPIINASDLANSLHWVRRSLRKRQQSAAAENIEWVNAALVKIEELIALLESASYGVRLRRWIGGWGSGDWSEDQDGHRIRVDDRKIEELAVEACHAPDKLTPDLRQWLCSEEAKRAGQFWWNLGKADTGRTWLSAVQGIGAEERGIVAFARYFGGWAERDRSASVECLEGAHQARSVSAQAVFYATTAVLEGDAGADRIIGLIRGQQIDPHLAAKTLAWGGWLDSISLDKFRNVLEAIAGDDLRNAADVFDLVVYWLHFKRPIVGHLEDFIWRCLEMWPGLVDSNLAYACDTIAAYLVARNSERGFALLQSYLTAPYRRDIWNPLERDNQRAFWEKLCEIDRSKALKMVLEAAVNDSIELNYVAWDLPELVDLQYDREFLLEYSLLGEKQAIAVSKAIKAEGSDFWPIALGIAEAYADNRRILEELEWQIERIGGTIVGPHSAHLNGRIEYISAALTELSPSLVVRQWLDDFASRLQVRAEASRRSEADERINWH